MILHRKFDDGDIYFVDNRADHAENVDATFRIGGKAPELWDPATGTTQPASYQIASGRTTVPLHLDSYGTTFVVFRAPTSSASREIPAPGETVIAGGDDALNRGWSVIFERDKGAPASARFDSLSSWSDNPDPGIRYFSGTATYTRAVEVPASAFAPGAHLWLDLGDVKEVASVAINNKQVGTVWKAPYRIDVTGFLAPGNNRLLIQVTNLWVNRLIGDQQPWALKKYAFADFTPYKPDSPLLPSGLLGPVRLLSVSAQ
jgi:hypothetical protein